MPSSLEIPFAFEFYQSRILPWQAQRIVNLYAELGSQGSKTSSALIGTPGLAQFASVGNGPIRGMHNMRGTLFVVSGADVFTVNSSGTATNIGTVGGLEPVIMDDNGIQVAIASEGGGYIATTGSVVSITDGDFIGSVNSVTYMNSFFVWLSGDIMQNSAAFDGLSYAALDKATLDYDPDDGVRVFRDHAQLLAFGTDSGEIWVGADISTFPFAPLVGSAMEAGLIAKDSIAKVDNSVLWLGKDERGGLTVWRLAGGRPVRVSTHGIEKLLEDATDIEDARAFSYREEGHIFYVLTLPQQFTVVYDAATGFWHERETFGSNSWRAQNYVSAFNKNLVGDSSSGQIFQMDLDLYTEAGTTIERIATTPPIQASADYVRHSYLRIDFEAGVGLTVGQGSDPKCMLSWSDDGGKTFGSELFEGFGKIGEYEHITYWNGLGKSRVRNYRVRVTDPVKVSIMGGFVRLG